MNRAFGQWSSRTLLAVLILLGAHPMWSRVGAQSARPALVDSANAQVGRRAKAKPDASVTTASATKATLPAKVKRGAPPLIAGKSVSSGAASASATDSVTKRPPPPDRTHKEKPKP